MSSVGVGFSKFWFEFYHFAEVLYCSVMFAFLGVGDSAVAVDHKKVRLKFVAVK